MSTRIVNGNTYSILSNGIYKPFGKDEYYEVSGGYRKLIGNRSQVISLKGDSALGQVQELHAETIMNGTYDGGVVAAPAGSTAFSGTAAATSLAPVNVQNLTGGIPGSGQIGWSFGAGNPVPVPLILAGLAFAFLFFRK